MAEEELEKLEKPDPAYVRQVPATFVESLKRIEDKEAAAAAEQQQKREADEARIQARIDSAVETALAAKVAELEAAAAEKQAAAAPSDAGASPAACASRWTRERRSIR